MQENTIETQISKNDSNYNSLQTTKTSSIECNNDEYLEKKEHQLIHLIGKLLAKLPLVSKKDIDEDTDNHKSGTVNCVSMLTIKSANKNIKIVSKMMQPDEKLKRWQKKKLESIMNNTHLSMIKQGQPKDYSFTTQSNIGETFFEYKKKHDLVSCRRIYIMCKFLGMLKVEDLLSPLNRWYKNHDYPKTDDCYKKIDAFAEYLESLVLEKNDDQKEPSNRAILFQKIICNMYYDHVILNLQDRKSNNVCLAAPIYDNKNNVLPNLPDELLLDIDTEDINGYKFMFDSTFSPKNEKEREKIVAYWMDHLRNLSYKSLPKIRINSFKRRLSVDPMELVKKATQNYIMVGLQDKDLLTGCIYGHLSRALAYWQKLLNKDKTLNKDYLCRRMIKNNVKNYQRCINKYWTELTKETIYYGKLFEETIKQNQEERQFFLQEATKMLIDADAFGFDIEMDDDGLSKKQKEKDKKNKSKKQKVDNEQNNAVNNAKNNNDNQNKNIENVNNNA